MNSVQATLTRTPKSRLVILHLFTTALVTTTLKGGLFLTMAYVFLLPLCLGDGGQVDRGIEQIPCNF